MKMWGSKIITVLVILSVMVLVQEIQAMPYRTLSRQKRISDQRLAELETLIALSKMKSKMVTVPVGFGRVDPLKLGRRKRSMEQLLKDLLREITSVEANDENEKVDEDNGAPPDSEDLLSDEPVQEGSRPIAGHLQLPVRPPE